MCWVHWPVYSYTFPLFDGITRKNRLIMWWWVQQIHIVRWKSLATCNSWCQEFVEGNFSESSRWASRHPRFTRGYPEKRGRAVDSIKVEHILHRLRSLLKIADVPEQQKESVMRISDSCRYWLIWGKRFIPSCMVFITNNAIVSVLGE